MAAIALSLVPQIPEVPVSAGTLQAIEEHLSALVDTAELVPIDQEQAFVQELTVALTTAADKRDKVAGFLAHLEAQQAYASAEIARLQAFKRSRELQQTRLEQYIAYVIESLGKDAKGKYRKLEGHTSTLSLRACPASVEVQDETEIPLDFKRANIEVPAGLWNDILNLLEPEMYRQVRNATSGHLTVDKRAVKAAIEAGGEVPGAKLVTDKTSVRRT